jgi:type II secretory ATPase GspE/PulE/Tfp pilus assembly ATPase PilB-like protein
MSDEIRSLVIEQAGLDEIRARALAQGMRTMREDGIDKVRHGLTTLAEIARVSCSL